jgi:hypothetical protein
MRAARILCPITAAFFLTFAAACATSDEDSEAANASAQPIAEIPADAAEPAEPPPSAITVAPASGTHLDGALGYKPRGHSTPTIKGKVVELVLRSTPPGATASIDGKEIGVTPTFWSGAADQRAHEFTFVKAGHSMARYRFVATHSGVVHGNLAKLQTSDEAKKAATKAAK